MPARAWSLVSRYARTHFPIPGSRPQWRFRTSSKGVESFELPHQSPPQPEAEFMPGPRSHASPSPPVRAAIVLAILVVVVPPAATPLHSVQFPGKLFSTPPTPSPHGYTGSL